MALSTSGSVVTTKKNAVSVPVVSRSAPSSPRAQSIFAVPIPKAALQTKTKPRAAPAIDTELQDALFSSFPESFPTTIDLDEELETEIFAPVAKSHIMATQSRSAPSSPRASVSMKTAAAPLSQSLVSQAIKAMSKSQVGVTSKIGDPLSASLAPVSNNSLNRLTLFYDEKWAEKQERTFVRWLNFVFQDNDAMASEPTGLSHSTVAGSAPASAAATQVTAWSQRIEDARCRRAAHQLYRQNAVMALMLKLEQAVEAGRIGLREEKSFFADVGVRAETLKQYFMSIDARWMKLALETVFGQVIALSAAHTLKQWLMQHVFANPSIEQQFATGLVSGNFHAGYHAALGKYTLKRVLQIFVVLEMIKQNGLLPSNPCLFRKVCLCFLYIVIFGNNIYCKFTSIFFFFILQDSPFKNLTDLLNDFSKHHLKSEGNLVRHLTSLGCSFAYKQMPIDEMNFSVTNLAIDLRDGVRLAKCAELLLPANQGIMKELRLPSDSRLRKIHNVEVALRGLTREGGLHLVTPITADDIVDGHRNKTFDLLYEYIFYSIGS